MREIVLREEPLCRPCQARGRIEPATIADHIKPLSEGGTGERENYQGICKPCHDTKTAEEAARARGARPTILPFKLHEGFLPMAEAFHAKPMRWLAIFHSRLHNISHSATSNVVKLIAALLCLPIFHLHDALFQFAYARGQRRLRLLCREQALLGIEQMGLEVELDLIDRVGRLNTVEGLKDVLGRLQAIQARTDLCEHNSPCES
ncbi:HNH endonuclease [Sphingobium yanoikuyae]|uniref:HNH endonuclease n=1 Tax=Sphingobium yanoikuyae TaxID=13690 RepID=UPI003F0BED6B